MSNKKMTPQKVSEQYQKGIRFNSGINLYDTVDINEKFFVGRQWDGVQSNGLPTPVFNFLKRVVLFSVANISTDNLKLNAKPLPSSTNMNSVELEQIINVVNDQFANIFEQNRMGGKIRQFCRDSAVDGDGCLYTYWNADAETGQDAKGCIRTEVLQNTQVIFGNPNDRCINTQPYIIIERRMVVKEAKKYAKKMGCSNEQIDLITGNSKQTGNTWIDALGGEKVSVLLRLWRSDKTGTIHGYECTDNAEIRPEWDLGIDLYPLSWMPWDYVQNCYHGQAMITGLIPNQIFVNKLFAMSMISLMTLAYPKIIYDRTKINKWSAKVGSAIGVNGAVDNVAKIIDPAQISPQISQFIDIAISYTQKFLGASDVALGDTRPDNTSAIIALQRAAATPMELTKQNLLECIEEQGRIYLQFMREYYGTRFVEIDALDGTKNKVIVSYDFNNLKNIPMSIDLDAGASSYWSEIANMQTLDNLLMQNKISTSEYLRRLPNGQITDRESLIAVTQAAEQQQMLQVGQDGQMSVAPDDMSDVSPELRGGGGYSALQRKINEDGKVPRMEV